MPCSNCNQPGHNKRTCKNLNKNNVKGTLPLITMKRNEVQSHGFSWERDILENIYKVLPEDLKTIKYTSEFDLPSRLNSLDNCNLSIKTSGNINSVCMADCLRVYDEVDSGEPFHLIVIFYKQNTNIKRILSIVQVDLTNSKDLLFGLVTKAQIEELVKAVKSIPQKRKPTEEEYKYIYSIRDKLHEKCGYIHLDIKCNSTQSRLQCSFNHFQTFINEHSSKLVAHSNTNEFRGGMISSEIVSGPRVFKKYKQNV